MKRLQHRERLLRDGKLPVLPSNDRERELEKIIRHITTIHMQQTPHTPEFFKKLPEKEKEFLVSVLCDPVQCHAKGRTELTLVQLTWLISLIGNGRCDEH